MWRRTPGYLTHSEPGFFLFFLELSFLECGAQCDEQLLDILGLFFLSDLPAEIPDSVVYSGHTGNCSSADFIFYDGRSNEGLSGCFPRATALLALNCGACGLGLQVPAIQATGAE
jgi:hypothetical protein